MNTLALYTGLDEISSHKTETRSETLQSVINERAERERELVSRHPMVPVFVNWAIVFMLIALTISLIIWGIDSTIRYKASQMTAHALAEREQQQVAEQQAEAERLAAIAQSEESIIEAEAVDCAKALYGIRLFVDKYHYTAEDMETYLRSAFNRADARGLDLHSVLSEPEQYLAYSEKNTVLDDYKEIAKAAVREWHTETSKPCDLDYQFAELRPDGVWLVKDINADGYARRWRRG